MEDVVDTKIAAPRRRAGIGRWFGILGLILLALALAALIYELLTGLNAGGYRPIAAGELWFRLHATSLNLCQAVIQRYVHPMVWDPVVIGVLQWPAWSILGAPGALLVALFGPWNPRKG